MCQRYRETNRYRPCFGFDPSGPVARRNGENSRRRRVIAGSHSAPAFRVFRKFLIAGWIGDHPRLGHGMAQQKRRDRPASHLEQRPPETAYILGTIPEALPALNNGAINVGLRHRIAQFGNPPPVGHDAARCAKPGPCLDQQFGDVRRMSARLDQFAAPRHPPVEVADAIAQAAFRKAWDAGKCGEAVKPPGLRPVCCHGALCGRRPEVQAPNRLTESRRIRFLLLPCRRVDQHGNSHITGPKVQPQRLEGRQERIVRLRRLRLSADRFQQVREVIESGVRLAPCAQLKRRILFQRRVNLAVVGIPQGNRERVSFIGRPGANHQQPGVLDLARRRAQRRHHLGDPRRWPLREFITQRQ